MTNDEIQRILEEHHEMISYMAWIAYHKLRKPTYLRQEDLIQEANLACCKHLHTYAPHKGASIRSFLFVCTLRVLTNIVRASWTVKEDRDGFYQDLHPRVGHSPLSDIVVQEFLESLDEEESYYVQESLAKPNSYSAHIRRDMGITRHEELKLRKRIREKSAPIL
jgi:DNA-directed RNA polymerase specialized sigma24 family protein